jgi:hypothetical protein|tara:strand:- start:1551 stop:1694 length:144 start_codon:yes stop_codon:yes gene_type:complete
MESQVQIDLDDKIDTAIKMITYLNESEPENTEQLNVWARKLVEATDG